MSSAPLRENEVDALESLNRLQVMDSAPEPAFDALVRAASLVCGVPISLISLIDTKRQWFKANLGLPDVSQTPRDVAFCAHAMLASDVFEVSDATQDPRFAQNPMVLGDPSIRFYAGMPLQLSDGNRIGALCIIDRQPRTLTEQQRDILRSLGEAAAQLLEGRRALEVVTQAEAALALERQRLANIIEATDVGTWELNVTTGEARLNGRWAQMLGTTLEALHPTTMHTWSSSIHPDDAVRVTGALQHHVAGLSKRMECEFRVKHHAGHWVWVIDRGRVMTRDAQGAPEWVVGSRVDVTLRKQREDLLRRNQEFLDRTGRVGRVGGWELELGQDRPVFSSETERLHGLEPGQRITIEEAFAFYPPEARPKIREAFERCVSGGSGFDLELPFIRATGQRIWVRVIGSAEHANGKVVRLIGVLQDVTERVAEHLALKAANDRVAVATDSGGIGVWEFDLKTRTAKWDPRVFKLYGLPTDSDPIVTEAVWGQRITPEGLAAIREAFKNAVEGKADFEVEFSLTWPDGSHHFLRSSARLIKDEQGQPLGMIGANWDITEQRRLAGVLRKQSLVASVQAGVAVAANEAKTLNEALQACVDLFCAQTGWAVGHAYVPSADHADRLVPSEVWSPGAHEKYPAFCQETARSVFSTEVGPVATVMRDQRPMHLADLSFAQFVRRASAKASGLTWGVLAPVLVGDELVAVLEFFSGTSQPFDPSLLELLSYTGLQIGRVVDRERAHAALHQQAVTLKQQSVVDELTGLYNRRGFLELAGERLKAAARTSQRAFLVFADLDGMKRINDELGHEAGDSALIAAAEVLRRTLRSVDVVARLGGDEFVALTCETGVFDVDALVRRLEGEVTKLNAESKLEFRLEISFGVSEPAGENESIHDLLKRADEAMYLKKQHRKAADS